MNILHMYVHTYAMDYYNEAWDTEEVMIHYYHRYLKYHNI